MKGKDPEERLKNLLPTENLKNKFQETVKNYLKATFKEKTLSKDEMNQLLVRKMLELTNPNSEHVIKSLTIKGCVRLSVSHVM